MRVTHGGDGIGLLEEDPVPSVLVKSPGIPFETPLIRAALERGLPVIDEAELGWRLDHRPLVGVTGTNGKSTSVNLVAGVLRAAGHSPVVAGNTLFGEPLSTAADLPGDLVVAELSSFQLEGCPSLRADAALLTNLTHDHLYRHGTAGEYERTKRKLFFDQDGACPGAAVGIDQGAGQRLADDLRSAGSRVVTFGLDQAADRRIVKCEVSGLGSRVEVSEGRSTRVLELPQVGLHNGLNAAGALALADALDIDPDLAAQAIEATPALPGRFEPLDGPDGSQVFVDYAHNPDGISQAISAGRARLAERGHGSLTVVMSALSLVGYDQAYAMGKTGAAGADHLILTSQRSDPDDPPDRAGAGAARGRPVRRGGDPPGRTRPPGRDRAGGQRGAAGRRRPGARPGRGTGGNLFDADDRPRPVDDRVEVRAAVERLGG